MMFEKIYKINYIYLVLFFISSIYAQMTGNFSQVIEGFNWGPGVTKIIIHFNSEINYVQDEINPSVFKVSIEKQGNSNQTDRIIKKVYISDENGNEINKNSNYITLEMTCHPALGETNPFYYDFSKTLNDWADPYNTYITLTSDLIIGTQTIEKANFNIDVKKTKNFLIGIDNVLIHLIEVLLFGFMELVKEEQIQQLLFMEIK